MEPKPMDIMQKSVYGQTKNYPACDVSRLFCEVAGTKTLPRWMLHAIESSGLYTIRPVAPSPTPWK
jgi:hypothetical protein